MDQPDPSDHPFSVEFVRALVHLMSDRDLSVVDLKWREARIRLVRGNPAPSTGAVSGLAPPAAPAATVSPAAPSAAATPSAPSTAETKAPLFITSSLVGTFFVASSPESEPYVRVGSKVGEDTIVCMIEAMKVFNEIPAGLVGTIAEVMVENGAPVEYGQPLFRVET